MLKYKSLKWFFLSQESLSSFEFEEYKYDHLIHLNMNLNIVILSKSKMNSLKIYNIGNWSFVYIIISSIHVEKSSLPITLFE